MHGYTLSSPCEPEGSGELTKSYLTVPGVFGHCLYRVQQVEYLTEK